MPNIHKIGIMGIGRIERIVYSGTAALNVLETKPYTKSSEIILTETVYKDYTGLVKIYKKVLRKYYPEKGIIICNKNNA